MHAHRRDEAGSTDAGAPDPSKRLLLAGFLTLIITFGVGRFLYTPLLPIMQREYGLTISVTGLMASFNLGAYLLGSLAASFVPGGRLRLPMFRASLVLSVASTLLMGLTDQVWIWVALRGLAGLTTAFALILAAAMLTESFARVGEEARVGWIYAGMGTGIVASTLLVAPAGAYLSSSQLWIINGIAVALLLPFIFRELRVRPLPVRSHRMALVRHQPQPLPFWPLLFTYSIGGIGFATFSTFIVALVKSRPETEAIGDWVWILTGLGAIPSGIVSAWLGEKIGFARALMVVYVVQVTSITMPAVSDNGIVAMVAAVLFGLTLVATPVLVSALGRHGVGGRGFGILTFGGGVGQTIGPLIASQIVHEPTDYPLAFYVAIVSTLVGMAVLYAAMLYAPHRGPESSRQGMD